MEYLKAIDIAKDLCISKSTVQKYIQEKFLPAKLTFDSRQSYYVISGFDYIDWKSKHFAGVAKHKISKYTRRTRDLTLIQIQELKTDWLNWCATSKLGGKPIAERTIEIYGYYFELYLKKLGKYPPKPIISVKNLRELLGSINVKSHSTLFESSEMELKRLFVKLTLSNLKLKGSNLVYDWVRPFDVILASANCSEWLPELGSNQRPIG